MKKALAPAIVLVLGMVLGGCGKSPEPAAEKRAEETPAAAAVETLPPAPPAWKAAPAVPEARPAKKTAKTAPAARTTREEQAAARPAPEPAPQPAAAAAPAAAAPAPAAQPATKPVYAPREPMRVTLAAGSVLAVRIGETLTSEKNETGDRWTGTLAEPVIIDGMVIAEKGGRVTGKVVEATRAGKVKGVAELDIAVTGFHTSDGQDIAVSSAAYTARGADETKKDAAKVAIASGIGAAIGAIAGKGKGAAIGAGAGAAAGTGAVLMTRGKPAEIPVETVVRFRVANAVTITEKVPQ